MVSAAAGSSGHHRSRARRARAKRSCLLFAAVRARTTRPRPCTSMASSMKKEMGILLAASLLSLFACGSPPREDYFAGLAATPGEDGEEMRQ